MENDNVNHPSHYCNNDKGIECIDAMEAAIGKEATSNFCLGNAFKYIFRAKEKQPVESIQKSIWYLNKYQEISPSFSEIWKPCLDGKYEVSNTGKVRLLGGDKIRKPIILKNGYATILSTADGKPICSYIHRLVAEAFIPNPNNLPCINHIDHNRTNNNVENLEWCDYKYNTQDALGVKVWVYLENGEYIGKFNSFRECENTFGIGHGSIQRYYLNKDYNPNKFGLVFKSYPLYLDEFPPEIKEAIILIWRAGLKKDASLDARQKEIEDLKKAIWYINDRIKQLEKDNNNENT